MGAVKAGGGGLEKGLLRPPPHARKYFFFHPWATLALIRNTFWSLVKAFHDSGSRRWMRWASCSVCNPLASFWGQKSEG